MSDERQRIEFLIARDGEAAARAWVERTALIYREALRASAYGTAAPYRYALERAAQEFEEWLATRPAEPRDTEAFERVARSSSAPHATHREI